MRQGGQTAFVAGMCRIYFLCAEEPEQIGQDKGMPKIAESCFRDVDSTPSVQHHTGANVPVSSVSQIWDAFRKGAERFQ